MKKKRLIIIGAGEFAEIAYEYFTHDSEYEVLAFSVEQSYISHERLFDLPVVPFENLEQLYSPDDVEVFVAVTFTKMNRIRTKLYHAAKAKGYQCARYISSQAFVWHNVKLGENCFIFENNVIQYHAEIGNNVVLWSGNHVGHRTKIGHNCFVSSQVVISGYTEIGENCFLGVNSTFADSIKVAKDCFIGAGALITKNTTEAQVFPGKPTEPSTVNALRFFKIKDE